MVLDKEQILLDSEKVFQQLTGFCRHLPPDLFFNQPHEKWSVAQNLQHLIISLKTTTAAYALPRFLVRLIGGRPNRPSRSYEELVEKYKTALANGGKARGRYVPGKIGPAVEKEQMLADWKKATKQYLEALRKNWQTNQLDQYIAPHPLLGKITLRELCYFTIYHTEHHLETMKESSK